MANIVNSCDLPLLGGHRVQPGEIESRTLARLWGGMGYIYRIEARSHELVIKHITWPSGNLSRGDKRKADSYHVEANFYENVAANLHQSLRLPKPYYTQRNANDIIIAMSYIETSPRETDERSVVSWLASFHAHFWNVAPGQVEEWGLQPQGTYWYLDTRPDEHANMPTRGWEGRLKLAARAIDDYLKRHPCQSIVHGDPKLANVLTKEDGSTAMCDFQYCGRAMPLKDLAYFLSTSSDAEDDDDLLRHYHDELAKRLPKHDVPSLEDLRDALDVAYCDFYRFMSGWGFWGSSSCESRVVGILNRLDGGSKLSTEEDYERAILREFG